MKATRIHLHKSKPIADGISFSDSFGMTQEMVSNLCGRRLLWETVWECNGVEMSGDVVAKDQEQAEAVLLGRGLGERVVGPLAELLRNGSD